MRCRPFDTGSCEEEGGERESENPERHLILFYCPTPALQEAVKSAVPYILLDRLEF